MGESRGECHICSGQEVAQEVASLGRAALHGWDVSPTWPRTSSQDGGAQGQPQHWGDAPWGTWHCPLPAAPGDSLGLALGV